jgi:hypothetical protein
MLRVLGIPEYLFFKLVYAVRKLEIRALHALGVDGFLNTVDFHAKPIHVFADLCDVALGGHGLFYSCYRRDDVRKHIANFLERGLLGHAHIVRVRKKGARHV